MSELTLNHEWAADPDPLVPVSVHLICGDVEQAAVFNQAEPESKVLLGDGVCNLHVPVMDSGVETVGDCGDSVNLTQDATCNFQSVQFDQSVPALNAWGFSMLVISVALVAAWFMRK